MSASKRRSDDAEPGVDASDIVIETEGIADTETAAVTVVLQSLLAESAGQAVQPEKGLSAWQLSQRGLRKLPATGPAAWRSFSG